jgi:hypothetical protein
MGLKRKNPARTRLLAAAVVPAVIARQDSPAMSAPATVTAISAARTPPAPVVEVRTEPEVAVKAPEVRTEPVVVALAPKITGEERHRRIAKAAYRHAEQAGFRTDPLQNWLRAEREIDAELSRLAS